MSKEMRSQEIVEYAIQHGILSYTLKHNGEMKNCPAMINHIVRALKRKDVALHLMTMAAPIAGLERIDGETNYPFIKIQGDL